MKTATEAFIELSEFLDGRQGIHLRGEIKVQYIAQGEVCVSCRYFLDKGPQDRDSLATWYANSLEDAFGGLHLHLAVLAGVDLPGVAKAERIDRYEGIPDPNKPIDLSAWKERLDRWVPVPE